jgi:hypothetical protein
MAAPVESVTWQPVWADNPDKHGISKHSKKMNRNILELCIWQLTLRNLLRLGLNGCGFLYKLYKG